MTSTNGRIASVHLRSRVKQSLVAMLSVVFGVSMYIFMNSFMAGVNDAQTTLAFSTLAHIRIYNDRPEPPRDLLSPGAPSFLAQVRNQKNVQFTDGIRHSSATIEVLKTFPGVEAVAPEVNLTASLRSGAIRIDGTLSGVDIDTQDAVFGISHYLVSGRWEDLRSRSDGIVIGKSLAEKLGVDRGDDVQVVTPDGPSRVFKVTGIVQFAVASIDSRKAFANIAAVRQMSGHNADFATDLQVRLGSFEEAPGLARRLGQLIPFTVEPWQQASGQLEAGSELRDIIALAVSLAILIVAGFGIYNIMNTTVSERMREIAILNAMGFASSDIVSVFLMQAVAIGLLGGVVGTGLGMAISVAVDSAPFRIATLDTLPMAYQAVDYVLAFVSGLLTTFVAGFLPAYKASRLDPVAILRG